ncbi:hypothetical protein KIN20_033130 [Parelaphostrongylus tenuis]|uniref:Uncharacterized protein n=1 Tax=Parelaphostrongylus tenuis TaxID=148309 RepID=A0AAD5R9S0_PARTN|nr:hypothetical protein KIN20_033130 [Parelaphostrongylus tenuis]
MDMWRIFFVLVKTINKGANEVKYKNILDPFTWVAQNYLTSSQFHLDGYITLTK